MSSARTLGMTSALLLAACGGASAGDGGSGSGDTTAATTGSEASSQGTLADSSAGGSDSGETPPFGIGVGPYAAGHASAVLTFGPDREGRVEFWYPAAPTMMPSDALVDFEPAGERHDALAMLVDAAPEPCTRRVTDSIREAMAADTGGAWPTVVFSHCSNCSRLDGVALAERLASWGFLVAAPDHEGNTVYDWLAGESVGVNADFLPVRGADIVAILDALAADEAGLPAVVRGHADLERVGIMGHSFGSVTAGWVAQSDDRVDAVMGIAAPFENPVLPGVMVASIDVPVLFLLAQEDNSILEIGNNLIRNNYDAAASPAWLVEFVDAGHWSFSDICALTTELVPGCGEGMRMAAPHDPFTYVDIESTRARASDWAAAFFGAHVVGDASAQAWLSAAASDDAVLVQSH